MLMVLVVLVPISSTFAELPSYKMLTKRKFRAVCFFFMFPAHQSYAREQGN